MNKAKRLIKKIEEKQSLAAANCEFYNEKGGVCETGAVRSGVRPGDACPYVSPYDSAQVTCTSYRPKGGSSDRRFHV